MSDPVFLTIEQVKTLHRIALDQTSCFLALARFSELEGVFQRKSLQTKLCT